jgi:hypothetical protein
MVMRFLKDLLCTPLCDATKYVALWMVLLGCALILLSAALGEPSSPTDQLSRVLAEAGGAILGGGSSPSS